MQQKLRYLSNYSMQQQEYPVFRPEKYSGLGLILSNQSYRPDPTPVLTSSKTYETSIYPTFRQQKLGSSAPPRAISPPQGTSNVKQRIKGQMIKGQSRIQYVPVEKKIFDYVDEPRYTVVPRKRTITDYRDVIRVDVVPRQVISTDYYAVEHIRCYVPQVIPESYVDYVPVQRKNIKYEYIPVERQILHCPDQPHIEQQTRYLGVKESKVPKTYQNLRESDIAYWEKQYGYVRGEPISVLNQKIRNKIQREKQEYFKQFQSKTTVENSRYEPDSRKY